MGEMIESAAEVWIRIWEYLVEVSDMFSETIKEIARIFVFVVLILTGPVWVGPYLVIRARVKK